MRLAIALLAALVVEMLVGVACLSQFKPEVVPVGIIAGQAEEATNVAPALASEADSFYVSFEVSTYESQRDAYPVTAAAFQDAMREWSKHVPVRWAHIPGESPLATRHGVIEVHFADIQAPPYNLHPSLLGLWDDDNMRLLLDADSLEENPEKAYSVAMHEIGHVFGLPHIVGFSELGHTGWIVLEPGVDATNYVMYFKAVVDRPQKELSSLEIKLARHHIVHRWTEPGARPNKHDCELYAE